MSPASDRSLYLPCLAGIALTLFGLPVLSGSVSEWRGHVSEDWGDDANSDNGSAPSSGRDVSFPSAIRPDSDLGGVTRDARWLQLSAENHRLYNGTLKLFLATATTIDASGNGLVHTLDCDVTKNSGHLRVNVGSGCTLVINGEVTGSFSLRKRNPGTLELSSGANSYAGGTIIANGTLLANNITGSATGSGNVTVDSGATLGGTGSVSGNVTASSGSIISPGASTGSLDLGASVFFEGTYRCEVGGSASDFLSSGSLRLLTGTLDIDVLPEGMTQPVYRIASYGFLVGPNPFGTELDVPSDYQVEYRFDDGTNANNIALVGTSPYNTWAISFGLFFADGVPEFDADGDGFSNGEEMLAETDPTDPASFPKVALTVYYDFEGDFNDAPDTGVNADDLATITGGGLTSDVPANAMGSTQSYAFDNNVSYQTAQTDAWSPDLASVNAYTIMFWFKGDDLLQNDNNTRLVTVRFQNGGAAAAAPAFQVEGFGQGSPNGMDARMSDPLAGLWFAPDATGLLDNDGDPSNDVWRHVAFVLSNRDGPTGEAYAETYVDGVSVGTAEFPTSTGNPIGNTEGKLILGGHSSISRSATGLLDDFALFKGVVPGDIIARIAGGMLSPGDDDLDGDGMPNNYEVENGLDPTTDDGAGDKDGDRGLNLYEWATGTDVNDPLSLNPLDLDEVRDAPGNVAVLEFTRNTNATGVTITLQDATNLVDSAAWSNRVSYNGAIWIAAGGANFDVSETTGTNPIAVTIELGIDTNLQGANYRLEVTAPDSGSNTGTGTTPQANRVVGYYVSWGVYARNYHVKNIVTSGSADKLTHLNFAFANIGWDNKVTIGDPYADLDKFYDASQSVDGVGDTWNSGVLRGNFNQLKKLKLFYPDLKILISVGGWTWSDKFSQMAMTASGRSTFIQSCIDIYIKGQFSSILVSPGLFDGVDIDWEYPAAPGNTNNYSPADTQNFTSLLSELRAALDAQGAIDGKQYLLTIAAPAGEDKFNKIEIGNIHPHLDFINLMTYDFHGAWDSTSNFHSPLHGTTDDPTWSQRYWADHTVDSWIQGGIPPNKLILGVPFYGRGWTNIPAGPNGDGLFQSGGTAASGTYESGMEDYKVLKNLIPSYNSYVHPDTEAFWIYHPGSGTFWSFDDPASMTNKMNYIKANDLGGAMFWELSGDDSTGSLIQAIHDTLNN